MNKTSSDELYEIIVDWAKRKGDSAAREACRRFFRRKTDAGVTVDRKVTPYGWLLAAWKRQKGLCFWCKDEISLKQATADHMHPLAKGGPHKRSNIVASCDGCNKEKGAKSLFQQSKETGEMVGQMIERANNG